MGRKWTCPNCGMEWEEVEGGNWESDKSAAKGEMFRSASGNYCADCIEQASTAKKQEAFLLNRPFAYDILFTALLEEMHQEDVERAAKTIREHDPELYEGMVHEAIYGEFRGPMELAYIDTLMEEN